MSQNGRRGSVAPAGRPSYTTDIVGQKMFTLDGCYKLDEDRRIARKLATFSHMDQALDFSDRTVAASFRNAFAALMENARMHNEFEMLEDYWQEEGQTKEQAVAAYLADNKDSAE